MEAIEKQDMPFEDALRYLTECQSEYNRLGSIVSTKDPDSLRCALDDEMRLRYELYGVKSYDVKIEGIGVATYSVVKTKEEPERIEKRLSITDEDAWKWVEAADRTWLASWLREHAHTIAMDYMTETGEMVPGARVLEEVVAAKPSMFKNTMLKVNANKMAQALAARESIALEG